MLRHLEHSQKKRTRGVRAQALMRAAHMERNMARGIGLGILPSTELALLNLTNLISRLEETVLSDARAQEQLVGSEYQRAKIAANIEHGRTLIHQLDRSIIYVKDEDRRGEIQKDLNQKRLQIRAIKQCLDDVDARAETTTTYINGFADDEHSECGADILDTLGGEDGDSYDDDGGDDDENDDSDMPKDDSSSVFYSQEPQLFPPMGERDPDGGDENDDSTSGNVKPSGSLSDPFVSTSAAVPDGDGETNTMRKRRQSDKPFSISPTQPLLRIPESETAAIATGTATARAPQPTSSTKPMGGHPNTADSKTQQTEANLAQARTEQESLTSSLLTLASQLKSSSQSFQTTLESEKTVLARAVEGLDRNITGMDAAGRRMGMLRRMTEGRGWWGRIMIYIWIAGLWVALLLIMFLMPKLRF